MTAPFTPSSAQTSSLFLSYCKADHAAASALWTQLAKSGYTVQHHNFDGPDSEHPILEPADLEPYIDFIALVSDQYAASCFCRRELNLAIEQNKALVAVYLEQCPLPLGMTLQLATAKQTHQLEDFLEIKACTVTFTADGKTIDVQQVAAGNAAKLPSIPAKEGHTGHWSHDGANIQRDCIIDAIYEPRQFTLTLLEADGTLWKTIQGHYQEVLTLPAPEKDHAIFTGWKNGDQHYTAEQKITILSDMSLNACWREAEPVPSPTPAAKPTPPGQDFATQIVDPVTAVLLQVRTGVCHILRAPMICIGRIPQQCDIAIPENSAISRRHAMLLYSNGIWYLSDANSQNGTYVDGQPLKEGQQVMTTTQLCFRLYDEAFILFCGDDANSILANGCVAFLQDTAEARLRMIRENLLLGRNHPWTEDCDKDPKMSRTHAEILRQGAKLYLCDKGSSNGTYLSKYCQITTDDGQSICMHDAAQRLEAHKPYALGNRDQIQMGDTVLTVIIVPV